MLNRLTKTQYELLDLPVLFSESEERYNRSFAVISKNGFRCKFAWNSDQVPVGLTLLGAAIYGVGIDQHFAIVDFTNHTVLLNTDFTYFYYCTEVWGNFIWIATELEVIKVDKHTFEIKNKYLLPEIFHAFIFDGDIIKVKCLDNRIIVL